MRISANAWHYRLLRWTYGSVPHSLCPYVDGLILAIVISPLVAVWKAVNFHGQLVMLTSGFGLIMALPQFLIWRNWILAIIAGQVLAYLVVGISWKMPDRSRKRKVETQPKPKEPSLLREWLHAKHRKVCPLLEFEYPDELRRTRL